jgi:hypothetical protein
MSKLNDSNPLLGVTIGSTIFSGGGKFNSSVVKAPISVMIAQEEASKSMSGQSSYVYSDEMNQGSLGMSGSYGVTGVSKLKSSFSAYVGKSSAASSKSVSVNYNAVSVGGIEYINFEQLNASEFLAGLNDSCRQSATGVLELYNKVIAEAAAFGLKLAEILIINDPKYDEIKKLVDDWVRASTTFTSNFGDGLVVGIIWGAYGGVNMLMTSRSDATSWKYGGAADFSYANVVTSVAVKATYDGGQSGASADVAVNCTSFVSGSVLASQIDAWLNQVIGKSFSELADVKVMDKAPDMKITSGGPPIPDFEKPKPSKDLTNKVGEIKDLDSLNTFAKAQAYDEAKKSNPELTLEQFLKDAEQPAETEELVVLKDVTDNNAVDTLNENNRVLSLSDNISNEANEDGAVPALRAMKTDSSDSAMAAKVEASGYVPLGVWVSNWADILPWMAQGYYNSIDKIEDYQAIQERVMLQDYQTLCRLYYIADTAGITEFKRKDPKLQNVSALSIANEFANAAGKMQEYQGNQVQIKKIFEELGTTAKSIYTLWNDITFLRNCELGLGLIKNNKSIDKSTTSDNERQVYSLSNCSFEGKNYNVFSSFFKVLPLITPDGEIWAFGPEKGGLSAIYPTEIIFSKPSRAKYLPFTCDKVKKVLVNKENDITLYPIPFSAANNVDKWKGMSLSTNIGSIKSFNESLNSLNDELNKLTAWTYSSQNWDKNWKGTDYYIQRKIKKQYLGLVNEIKNIL